MKKAIAALMFMVVAALAAVFLLGGNGKAPAYDTARAERGDITEAVTASGVLNPVNTVEVGTQVSGTISRIYADFNSPVKKGELIAEIDPSILEAKVAQSRAGLMQARADLETARAALTDAGRELKRKKNLLAREIVPQSEFDKAETAHLKAKAEVASAKARVALSEATLKQDETNLGYTKIRSPVDGIVISRNVNVGQTVAASFQTPTLFAIAEDLTKMQINASVDEADIGKVSLGQQVRFTVDAYPDLTFTGTVSQVRLAPTTIENVVTYDVVLEVENPDFMLKPGMTATVSIIVSEKKGVLVVPVSALTYTPPPQEGAEGQRPRRYEKEGIWTLKGGEPVRVEITTGASDGEYVEITSGGLKEGQEVIVRSNGQKKNNGGGGHRRGFL